MPTAAKSAADGMIPESAVDRNFGDATPVRPCFPGRLGGTYAANQSIQVWSVPGFLFVRLIEDSE
jgi:hypothetical protein